MGSLQTCRWHEFDSRISLEQTASRFILETAERAIAARDIFRIVLSGGNTPCNVYRTLCAADTDWSAWHIYFGDERCLPADDPERNSRMARTSWLDHVAIPSRQIHPIPGELGPETAAANYALDLAEVDEFDLVLLGLGEDGHTASLFPGGAWEHATALPAVIPVHDSPKPTPQRVSLSPVRLSHALCVMYLVIGKDKREAVMNWRAGVAIPASRICPPAGVDVFLHVVGDLSTQLNKF
jgi:6-phosphogluconolactonase